MEQIGKKWARLLAYLGGKLSIYPLSSSPPLSLSLPPSPQSSQAPSCAGWAGLVGPTLGSVSQMLPWGKQQHLSPAQPWLSLSDKSLGGSCQRCPPCHLSPLPPTQYPQPSPYTHIYTHTLHPIYTYPPSSWQCDRSRWFTPFLPSGLLCSRPRLAHLCRVRAGLSPLANTNGELPAPGFFSSGSPGAYRSCFSESGIKVWGSDKQTFTKVNKMFSEKKGKHHKVLEI